MFASLLACLLASSPPPYDGDVATQLIGWALSGGGAWSRLEELSDTIGPRLTGSEGAERAVAWAAKRLREDGLAVRLEPVKVPHWVRGEERGEILASPRNPGFPLAITALGGSVGTPPGGVSAEVVEARSLKDIAALGDKARGKIVFLNHTMGLKGGYSDWAPLRSKGPSEAGKVGAAGVILRSLATGSLRSPHTGATKYAEGAPQVPAAAVATEDAELIHRLLARGPVRVRFALGCRTLPDAQSANVIAEVRGREKPDEVVLLGAHLDSWDLATGASDDGAGVAIVMEAGRLIAKLPKAPRRTIRIVLYMNEENGLAGGKGYTATHDRELDAHVAALEVDAGGGRPIGVEVRTQAGGASPLRPWIAPLTALGVSPPVEGDAGGADLSPMGPRSVVLVSVKQETSRYFELHHSAADTIDHIDPASLGATAAAVTWVGYALAEMPERLPRPPPRDPSFTPDIQAETPRAAAH